jgi:thioredoxin-dependent peroxiredoxin
MVAVGEPAPDFEAPDQNGSPFRLSTLRGAPVALYFYPRADTPGCTIEAKGFQQHLGEFAARGVKIVGVSVDDCPAQKAFASKYGLQFTLVADAKKDVARRYGVLGPSGTAKRVTFLIDKAGTIAEVVDGAPDHHVERARTRFLPS